MPPENIEKTPEIDAVRPMTSERATLGPNPCPAAAVLSGVSALLAIVFITYDCDLEFNISEQKSPRSIFVRGFESVIFLYCVCLLAYIA